MTGLLEMFDAAGSVILEVTWIPILVWTIAGLILLGGLRLFQGIHVQYHYHLRLSILMSLPVGLFLAFILHPVSGLFTPIDTTVSILKFITLQPPIDLAATAGSSGGFPVLMTSWKMLLFMILSTGSCIMAGWYLLQYYRLCTLTRSLSLTPIDLLDSVSAQNKELAELSGKPVFLTFLCKPVVPVTYCLKHPVVILPASLADQHEKMNLVLRHELMHIKNRDYRTHMFMVFVRILFWFHPLVYHLYYQLIEYREMCCDNHVLSDTSISRKNYASVLFELLPMPKMKGEIIFHMAHTSSRLKKRIDLIRDSNIRRLPVKAGLSTFCLFLFLTALIMAGTEIKQGPLFDAVESSGAVPQFSETINEVLEEIRLTLNSTGFSTMEAINASENSVVNSTSYNNASFSPAQLEPELIGGLSSLQLSIRYPSRAARAGIDGPVRVQFDINKEGGVENATVVSGIGGGADEEALRVVNQAQFIPASQFGRPVKVSYTLNIYFRLASEPVSPKAPGTTQV